MTDKQRATISQKLKGIQPKEIKPYLQAINDGISANRFNTVQASKLMDLIYSIHALDRDWMSDIDNAQRNKLQDQLVALLRGTMNPQECEICLKGEDSLRFNIRRVCQDCINKM